MYTEQLDTDGTVVRFRYGFEYFDPRMKCPECGGQVEHHQECAGYGLPKEQGGDGVLVCWPPWDCDGGILYTCVGHEVDDYWEGECGWRYFDPETARRVRPGYNGKRPEYAGRMWWGEP